MNDIFSSLFAYSLSQLPYVIVSLIIAFTIHEFAHAKIADLLGDDTPREQGRVTLSPLAHIEPIGMLMVLFFGFGWAKPVQVRTHRLKGGPWGSIFVSLAGPLSNLILAFLGMVIWNIALKFGILSTLPESIQSIGFEFMNIFIWLNVMLFVFNMLPIPPLDGYRILEELAPPNIQQIMIKLENYAMIIFLIIVITPLSAYTIDPVFEKIIPQVNDGLLWLTTIIVY